MKIIAKIHNDFPTKFGIPRQSGLVSSLKSQIIFEPEYRNPDALRGLENFSHLWLIWEFSEANKKDWSPTVRPPRLGGNKRMGVFATRSPFRPNPIGLSAVKIESITLSSSQGPIINVSGADLMNDTPIFDIKPYLPYADSYPNAKGGFAEEVRNYSLEVNFPKELLSKFPSNMQDGIIEVLSQDPRPAYQKDKTRIYGFYFGNFEIKFTVKDSILTVCQVIPCSN